MVRGFCVIVQHMDLLTVGSNDGIYSSVIIDVSGRQTASDPGLLKDRSSFSRDIHEIVTRVSRQEHGFPVVEVWKR